MSSLCVVDQVPATVGNLCTGCAEHLVDLARQAPQLLEDLEVTLTRQARQVAPGAGGGHGHEQPMPLNVAAMEAGDAVRAVLAELAAASVAEGRRVPRPPGLCAQYITAHVDRVARHPDVGQWVMDLERAVDAGRQAVDRAPDRRVVGRCQQCQSVLVSSRTAGTMRCRYCGQEHELEHLAAQQVEKLAGLVLSASSVALALSTAVGRRVPGSTVRSWVHREQLTRVPGDGPPRYRVADALRVWREVNEADTPPRVGDVDS